MAVEGFLSIEEQRALVYEYLSVPYGGKALFLVERGVSSRQVRRWRSQVFADTLEQGLVPRAGGAVSVDEAGGLKRLLQENQVLREELAAREAVHQRELMVREEDLAVQRRVVDALGKAIEILHRSGSKISSDVVADPPIDPPIDPGLRRGPRTR